MVANYTALTDGTWRHNGASQTGTPIVITYTILDSNELPSFSEVQPSDPNADNQYTALDTLRQAAVSSVLQEYSNHSGITFVEVDNPEHANLSFLGNLSVGSPYSWAYFPLSTAGNSSNSHIVVTEDPTNIDDNDWAPGGQMYTLLLHETGHAVGLEHSHEGTVLDPALDSHEYTIMSYNWDWSGLAAYGPRSTLASLDIDALQYLYGSSSPQSLGWSWNWDEATSQYSLSGGSQDDTLIGIRASSTIDGGAGNDTLYGQIYDDVLRGEDGDDSLNGGAGADQLDGGAGSDTADYSGSSAASGTFVASLYNSNVNTDDAIGDTYNSIENLAGTSFNDLLYGNNSTNALRGNAGVDTLYGLGGDDTLNGGAGADRLYGGAGSDTADYSGSAVAGSYFIASLYNSNANTDDAVGDLYSSIENLSGTSFNDMLYGNNATNTLWGNDGDDFLHGGAGADRLIGGSGSDTASYTLSAVSGSYFIASLYNSNVNTDDAVGDTYSSIENLSGTRYQDILYGNNSDNTLWGNTGTDFLYGLGGNDFLNGGAGADRLYGGSGSDTADYSGSSVAGSYFIASLYNSNANTDDAIGDTYSSIENLSGTSFRDILYGNNSGNTLWGNNGNDFLYGFGGNDILNGGAGADRLYGGSGSDTADYSGSSAASGTFVASLYNSNVNTDYAIGDTYNSIENLSGTSFNDRLYGNNATNTLWGNDGDDFLHGGAGADRLIGGAGNDSLYGGAGADVFAFAANDGADRIYDFANGLDRIDFGAIAGLTYSGLNITAAGADTHIDYGTGTIDLVGIGVSQIDAGDFLFA